MNELIHIFRGMRMDADQAIQLIASGQHDIEDGPVILDRVKAWRDEIDALVARYGDPRDERT
jgi:hypothetical protein